MNQRRLGRYELQERLHWGSMGEVWKAFDAQQQRSVAIKIITVNPEASSEFLPWFNQEGQALAALRHPNIVPIQEFSIAQDQNEAYIVMDYVEGQSLAEHLAATSHTGNLSAPTEIVQLLMPIAAALDYAHQRGVLHGALKPGVILLDKSRSSLSSLGEPMLIDFGLQRRQDLRLQPVSDLAYIAPEIAQGYAGTSRSDLYSLGVMLYELCTGTLPFQGETASDMLMQHIHSTPISPVLINPHIRPALTGVIMRSLARDPAARFSSATALVTAVAKALNIGVPESMSQSNPGIGDIGESDRPTYFSSPLSSPSAPLPPMLVNSNPPVIEQNTVAPSITPAFPVTPMSSGTPQMQPPMSGAPQMQPPMSGTPQMQPPMSGAPQMQSSMNGTPQVQPPMSVTPFSSQPSGAYPTIASREPMPMTPLISPQSQPGPRPPVSFITSMGKRRAVGFVILAILLLAVLIGSGVLIYLTATPPPQTTIVGRSFFVSSGLISKESNQGITDELRISLQNIDNPAPGKSYYGWLMSSVGVDVPALALGVLNVDHGQIIKTYTEPNHNNLLANYSRFLITEEDKDQQPTNPSLDSLVWRYYAVFSTTPNPTDPKHYSLLDHLRHLLSQDPKLEGVGLRGGLSVWLFRNTTKILEAAGSARDAQKGCIGTADEACANLVLRQVARILDYLDGADYVQTENIPPNIQKADQLLIDPRIARVALLEFDPLHQQPPGYLEHIGSHLRDINQVPGATANQRELASRINRDINNVQGWLDALHVDASRLIHMTPSQVLQPETLTTLNDLFNQANAAFVGQVDPNTGNVKEGVVQIYYHIQTLATFDVALCKIDKGQSSCAGRGNS